MTRPGAAERGSATVLVLAAAAVTLAVGLLGGLAATLLAAGARARTAADLAALAAADAIGTGRGACAAATAVVAANGARLAACDPGAPGAGDVTVVAEVRAAGVAVRARARAEPGTYAQPEP